MEYSVYDLIRILLRRWYVVLLTMCLVGGSSVFVARQSYASALENYERLTTETKPIIYDGGNLIAVYQAGFEIVDFNKYKIQANEKDTFIRQYLSAVHLDNYAEEEFPNQYVVAEQAYAKATADFSTLLTDAMVLQEIQEVAASRDFKEPPYLDNMGVAVVTDPLIVSNHFSVILDNRTLTVTISGLEKTAAEVILTAYLQAVSGVGPEKYQMNITAKETAHTYFQDGSQPTDLARFSQTVLKKPEQAPTFIRIVGTSTIFSFVLACFGILLATFIRDTRPKKERGAQ